MTLAHSALAAVLPWVALTSAPTAGAAPKEFFAVVQQCVTVNTGDLSTIGSTDTRAEASRCVRNGERVTCRAQWLVGTQLVDALASSSDELEVMEDGGSELHLRPVSGRASWMVANLTKKVLAVVDLLGSGDPEYPAKLVHTCRGVVATRAEAIELARAAREAEHVEAP